MFHKSKSSFLMYHIAKPHSEDRVQNRIKMQAAV